MNESDRNSEIVPSAAAGQESDAADRPSSAHHGGPISRLRNYFLTGLVLVGPLYITAWLIWWFVNWVDGLVRPFIPVAYRPETYLPVNVPGTGLIIAFVALTLLGFLTANLVGRKLVELRRDASPHADRAADLQELKQIFETLFSKSDRASAASAWSSFRGPACGRWCSCRSRCQLPISRRHAGGRIRFSIHAVHAQSDHGLFLLRPAPRGARSRHYRRGAADAADVGRDGPAERRPAEEARPRWLQSARAPSRRINSKHERRQTEERGDFPLLFRVLTCSAQSDYRSLP